MAALNEIIEIFQIYNGVASADACESEFLEPVTGIAADDQVASSRSAGASKLVDDFRRPSGIARIGTRAVALIPPRRMKSS
jgi:hypothetical protein